MQLSKTNNVESDCNNMLQIFIAWSTNLIIG